MYRIQRLSLCDERERYLDLTGEQIATIGAASACSMRLHTSFGLPQVCLKVWMEGNTCIARNMTGSTDLIFLNGRPFFDIVQLENGDSLQVGEDQFLVLEQRLIVDPPPAAATTAVTPDKLAVVPSGDQPVERSFRSSSMNRTVMRHEPRDPRWTLEDFLGRLRSLPSVIQFVNFRHAGVAVPSKTEVRQDHFQDMPTEITELYSLHSITDAPIGTHLDVSRTLKGKDACLFAVPVNDAESCLADSKLYYAWLARPSVLMMTLRQCPRDFCVSLMKPFRAFILPESKESESWCLISDNNLRPEELFQR